MKKMCKHWTVTTAGGQMCDGKHYPRKNGGCPSNTNSKCEIIPRKPKMARIKAWVLKNNITEKYGCISMTITTGKSRPNDWFIPCVVSVDRKYLKGAK